MTLIAITPGSNLVEALGGSITRASCLPARPQKGKIGTVPCAILAGLGIRRRTSRLSLIAEMLKVGGDRVLMRS